MRIRTTIDKPMYTERVKCNNGKMVKTIKEECKTNHLLRIRIYDTDEAYSREAFRYILAQMCIACGNAELMSLSDCEWGRPVEYDEESSIWVDSICVPKDFDNLEVQKKNMVQMVKDIVKDMRINNVLPLRL